MRYIALLVVVIAAQIGAAWATGEDNVARPGGSYAALAADSAVRCERLCADDTLCMAWNFHENICELKAIVPAATTREGVVSGVSIRAPASMRTHFEFPVEPIIAAHEDEADPGVSTATRPRDLTLALLGGPEPGEELRGGLGN